MAADSSSKTSMTTKILGVIGAILIPVAIFYIEQKIPGDHANIVSINGRVFDRSAKRLVENAMVRLEIKGTQDHQNTDSEGRYAFSVEGVDPKLAASMKIEAAGYKPLTLNLPVEELSQTQDQFLDAAAPAPPGGLTATVDGGNPITHPAPAAAAKYVMRPDIKKLAVFVKH